MVKPLPKEVLEYLLYEKRLDSMRVEATWLGEIERVKIRAEKAEKNAEEAKKEAEEAKKREERLLNILKQAGIDPNC